MPKEVNIANWPGLQAARAGDDLHKYVDGGTVTASFVVQTAAAIYENIPEGKQIVIVEVMVGCETVDEECVAYPVVCSAVAGGGTPTQLCHHEHVVVGAKKEGNLHAHKQYNVPIVVKYSDGHRSVSLAVKATDTATVVTYSWCGWLEDEDT